MKNLHQIRTTIKLTEDQIVQLWYCHEYHADLHKLRMRKDGTPMCNQMWGGTGGHFQPWANHYSLRTAREMWKQNGSPIPKTLKSLNNTHEVTIING